MAPVADSWGVRLLQRMGWRQGKGIGEKSVKGEAWSCGGVLAGRSLLTLLDVLSYSSPFFKCAPATDHAGSDEADDETAVADQEGEGGSRRRRRHWGRPAGVGPDNTPLHLLKPKNDAHGLGYDPFK